MRAESGAVRGGVQTAASCGLHAVNHCLQPLGLDSLITRAAFDALARADERNADGDWEFLALQRNVGARNACMTSVGAEDVESLAYWVDDLDQLSLWRDNNLGCVFHVPGHWVALKLN